MMTNDFVNVKNVVLHYLFCYHVLINEKNPTYGKTKYKETENDTTFRIGNAKIGNGEYREEIDIKRRRDLEAKMSAGMRHGEEAIVPSGNDNEGVQVNGNNTGKIDEHDGSDGSKLSSFLWHGGSVWDAWFSCASNQVAQVLLTLPYSFSQLGMLSGIVLQIFYGLLGSWTAYLISVLYVEYRARKEKEGKNFKNHVIQWFEVLDGLLGTYWKALGLAFNCTFLLFGSVIQLIACASNIYYINDHLDKRTWTYIFGACCATTVFIPSFHNYRIWSFLGLGMTTYTAWYLAIASIIHGQTEGVKHSGPTKLVLYFTGATNILYTFGGHAVTVEIMHAMWKPQKFKYIYLMATLYVFTLTIPSASAVYWAFGDELLDHSNAFSLLPKNGWRDAAVILMLIHQFITFGFACTPLYFVWEKVIGMHDTKSICLRALARLPVVIPIWFLAIIFPFFGPINSAVGALLVSFTVYIIPSLAHMLTYRSACARQNAAEKPPFFLPSWTAMYVLNAFVVIWVLIVGFGFGGWASVTNFVRQVDTFGLFAKCYQCKPPPALFSAFVEFICSSFAVLLLQARDRSDQGSLAMVGPGRPQIVLFGSSIVQYSFINGGWGATLADVYSRTADIILRGYGGWNSRYALKVLNQVFPKDAVVQPSLVIVYFGGNDSKAPHPSGHGPHVPLSEFVENMRKIGEHLLSLSDKTRVIFLSPPPINETQIQLVFGNAIKGRSNEVCRPYAEALLNLCNEINVKCVDLWKAIQQQDDWLNTCFTDGIHFTAKASEVVVKEVLKVVKEADWKPSLHWKSLPIEFPFDFGVPNSLSLSEIELMRNDQLEPPPSATLL
ncbi:unnamed protein product [Brassica rapa]|uniref:Amino acid transporter transmembrane domain-containing protein n=2 Tax=Brassica campestris TaxID=3711 RepID=A0A8D9GHN5_BRACM|nr:unnamed protein product [Brassica rapa]